MATTRDFSITVDIDAPPERVWGVARLTGALNERYLRLEAAGLKHRSEL